MPPNETLGQGLKIGELCQDDITNTLVFFVNGEFENMFPSFLNINSDYICRPVVPGGARGTMATPDFGRSVNPISTKGADYSHQIILAPPDFQTF